MNPFPHLQIPVVAAPMFLISTPKLVVECCKNGIVGTFPALNQRSTEGFEEWLAEIKTELESFEIETGKRAAPFGVNLIVRQSNMRLMADLKVVIKHKVPLVITSLGAVSDLVNAVHGYGGLVFHDVTKKRHAEKAAEAGVDGLILVCAGAGGHAGTLNPMPFVHEVRQFFDKTILLSGAISTGQDIAAAMQMGADLAYMGTRFINTTEANADDEYKEMISESGTSDVVYTAAISGIHANFMSKSLEKANIPKEKWENGDKGDFGKELDTEGKAWKNIWSAGQGVAGIKDTLPTAQLIERLTMGFIKALEEQKAVLEKYAHPRELT